MKNPRSSFYTCVKFGPPSWLHKITTKMWKATMFCNSRNTKNLDHKISANTIMEMNTINMLIKGTCIYSENILLADQLMTMNDKKQYIEICWKKKMTLKCVSICLTSFNSKMHFVIWNWQIKNDSCFSCIGIKSS